MNALKAVLIYVVLPFGLIGGCIWYQSKQHSRASAEEAIAREVKTEQGYLKHLIYQDLMLALDDDNKIYLRGTLKNMGSRDVALTVRIEFTGNPQHDRTVFLGMLGSGQAKELDRFLKNWPESAEGEGRFQLSYNAFVSKLRFKRGG